MTVIAAALTKHGVAIGGDSGAFEESGSLKMHSSDPKVFKIGGWLVGVAGSFKVINLIAKSTTGEPYALVAYLQKEITGDPGDWSVLCASGAGLYELSSDYSVVRYKEPYASIGAASEMATGSLAAFSRLEGWSAKDMVQESLDVAVTHSTMCAAPFKIFTIIF